MSRGMRYHAKERLGIDGTAEFFVKETDVRMVATNMLLVRILIGKVEKKERLTSILRGVPIRQNDVGWNCVSWVQEALATLKTDGKALGTSITEWQAVRDQAMSYVREKKAEHQFDGQGNFDMKWAATYDLLDGKETIQ